MQYENLVGAHQAIPAVIADLEPLLNTGGDDARICQVLGDAYMQNNRLGDAVTMYRQALQALTRH